MRRMLSLVAIMALASAMTVPALAQKVDANGKCRDASGKFVAMSVCEAAKAGTSGETGGKCRDKDSKKFVKCSAPNSEPVPSKAQTQPQAPAPR